MKILFHCVYFPPEVGGLESHVYYLARAMVRRGHEVSVVTSRSQPDLPLEEVMDGIRVYRTWFPSRNPLGWVAHSLGSLSRTRKLAPKAEILHAQAFPSILPMSLGRGRSDIPLVATFHTSHFLTRAAKPVWRPILGKLVGTPDFSLAASQEIADVAMGLAPGVQVEALANGVETDVFRRIEPTLSAGERPRILIPRRLFHKNGVEFFVRALPEILRSVDVDAVFIGDGPEGPGLKALTEELGVSHRVTFLGKQDHASMPGLLSSGDLAVIPSLMEATSVAALESMACELPVLASNVGGLPEIIDDRVGGLFEAGNPGALARTVIETLEAGNLPELGRAARIRVKEMWSNDRLAERHLEIYTDLLEKRGRA